MRTNPMSILHLLACLLDYTDNLFDGENDVVLRVRRKQVLVVKLFDLCYL